jgi:hypothetical protein
VQNPVLSIFFYSILAFAAYQASLKYIFYESVLLVFARTCLFLVNISFWTASISGFKDVPGFVFAFAWFSLSLGLIYFGSTRNRKFLVNIGAVFAAINLYTLWFEMLGAHPVALIVAGVTIVGGSLWLWNFNKKSEN